MFKTLILNSLAGLRGLIIIYKRNGSMTQLHHGSKESPAVGSCNDPGTLVKYLEIINIVGILIV